MKLFATFGTEIKEIDWHHDFTDIFNHLKSVFSYDDAVLLTDTLRCSCVLIDGYDESVLNRLKTNYASPNDFCGLYEDLYTTAILIDSNKMPVHNHYGTPMYHMIDSIEVMNF